MCITLQYSITISCLLSKISVVFSLQQNVWSFHNITSKANDIIVSPYFLFTAMYQPFSFLFAFTSFILFLCFFTMSYIKPELISQLIDLQLTNSGHRRLERIQYGASGSDILYEVPEQNNLENIVRQLEITELISRFHLNTQLKLVSSLSPSKYFSAMPDECTVESGDMRHYIF